MKCFSTTYSEGAVKLTPQEKTMLKKPSLIRVNPIVLKNVLRLGFCCTLSNIYILRIHAVREGVSERKCTVAYEESVRVYGTSSFISSNSLYYKHMLLKY